MGEPSGRLSQLPCTLAQLTQTPRATVLPSLSGGPSPVGAGDVGCGGCVALFDSGERFDAFFQSHRQRSDAGALDALALEELAIEVDGGGGEVRWAAALLIRLFTRSC
jgi:hypothetical protein